MYKIKCIQSLISAEFKLQALLMQSSDPNLQIEGGGNGFPNINHTSNNGYLFRSASEVNNYSHPMAIRQRKYSKSKSQLRSANSFASANGYYNGDSNGVYPMNNCIHSSTPRYYCSNRNVHNCNHNCTNFYGNNDRYNYDINYRPRKNRSQTTSPFRRSRVMKKNSNRVLKNVNNTGNTSQIVHAPPMHSRKKAKPYSHSDTDVLKGYHQHSIQRTANNNKLQQNPPNLHSSKFVHFIESDSGGNNYSNAHKILACNGNEKFVDAEQERKSVAFMSSDSALDEHLASTSAFSPPKDLIEEEFDDGVIVDNEEEHGIWRKLGDFIVHVDEDQHLQDMKNKQKQKKQKPFNLRLQPRRVNHKRERRMIEMSEKRKGCGKRSCRKSKTCTANDVNVSNDKKYQSTQSEPIIKNLEVADGTSTTSASIAESVSSSTAHHSNSVGLRRRISESNEEHQIATHKNFNRFYYTSDKDSNEIN